MVSITPYVLPHHKNKNGFVPVKMRVYLNRRSRWIATNLVAYPKDLTRHCTLRDGAVKDAANKLAARMRECYADLSPFVLRTMTVDDIVHLIEMKMSVSEFHLDFFEFGREAIAKKKPQTQEGYITAMSAFKKFSGDNLDCTQITSQMLREFADTLPSSGAVYMRRLAYIYRFARAKYNDEDSGIIRLPRDPFAAVTLPKMVHRGQKSLPVDILQKMVDDKSTGVIRFALDIFLLSYGLMGINIADLWELPPPSDSHILSYERAKTRDRRADRAYVRCLIPAELQQILSRLSVGAMPGRWICLSRRYSCKISANVSINRALGLWAAENGVEQFTLYAARKSFATVCRARGVEKATIDECLAHVGDYRVADIYIERNWQLLWDAQMVAVSALQW